MGDRVIGSSVPPAGGFAELALMDAATTFPAPHSLNDVRAGAFFLVYQTEWLELQHRAHLQAGEPCS